MPYEKTGTVKSVKIDYDVEKQWGNWNPTFDMFLTITYNDGQDWDNTLEIYGNVKKDIETTDQKSWGSAFKIKNFFESVFKEKDLYMNNDYTIPDKWCDVAIGRQFMLCSYKTTKLKKSGKHFWDTYKIVARSDAAQGTLKTKVMKDVQDGWIKNYFTEDMDKDIETSASAKPSAKADFDLDI